MLETIKKYRKDLHQIPELELDLPAVSYTHLTLPTKLEV
mgnify:CR=1 FL=1